ncbi:hypothetical protein RHIZ404_200009 [Rhizobium sp. EC-SD404]|nr:hypothetical protein RHIZ404_200009 [Rhizobium sp. EC-SD404]
MSCCSNRQRYRGTIVREESIKPKRLGHLQHSRVRALLSAIRMIQDDGGLRSSSLASLERSSRWVLLECKKAPGLMLGLYRSGLFDLVAGARSHLYRTTMALFGP